MKYVILCIDGMSDFPQPELGNKTTMEAAQTPNLDLLTQRGAIGRESHVRPVAPREQPPVHASRVVALAIRPELAELG